MNRSKTSTYRSITYAITRKVTSWIGGVAFAVTLSATSTVFADSIANNEVLRLFEVANGETEVRQHGDSLPDRTIVDSGGGGDTDDDDKWLDPMFIFCLTTKDAGEEVDGCLSPLPPKDEVPGSTVNSVKLNYGTSIGDRANFETTFARSIDGPRRAVGVVEPSVDPGEFASNVHAQLANQVVGYAFIVAKNGQLVEQGQGGFAQVPFVDNGELFTVDTDVNVFSVSKTITAIAVLQLMEKLGLTPDDPIADWLPPTWNKGFGFSWYGITFFDLLTHRTGIRQTILQLSEVDEDFATLDPNTYAGLKAIVEHGIYPEFANVDTVGYGSYAYKNANYALARILIWQMGLETGDITSNFELAADFDSALGYQHYVRQHVLQQAGVDGFCYATGSASQRALAYDISQNTFPILFTAGGSMGGTFPGGLLTSGPMNWWLSAMDLGAVAAHLHYGDLLSPESRELMDDLRMGWQEPGSKPERYWHSGLGKSTRLNQQRMMSPWHPGNPTDFWLPSEVTTEDRVQSCFMKLPGGLDVSLVMNSNVRNDESLSACDILHTAFEDAQ